MVIWIMNHYASDMFRDKAGRHYWFAKKLEEHGHNVTIFCAQTYLNSKYSIKIGRKNHKIQMDGNTPFVFIKTNEYTGNGKRRFINMLNFFWNLKPAAKEYTKQYGKPDVIIASSVHPLTMVAGIQIAKNLKVPCICEIRDLWPEAIFSFNKVKKKSLIGRILINGEHWIYRKADALIFTKAGDTDYLKEEGWTTDQGGDIDLTKCYYINNGVNLSEYRKQMETEILYDDDLVDRTAFNVVYTGAIRPVNNVDNMLDCATVLKDETGYEKIKFLIYGEGSELEKLYKRVEDEKLFNVKLKGIVDRKHIPYILSKSSVNILNYTQSQYNWTRGNSSNKLFEYMASGKPVISNVQMGYSIIKKYCFGIELDESTPEKLAVAIKNIHDMPTDEYEILGKNATKGAEDFDFDVLTKKLLDVIAFVTAR